ncbi:MAG: FMN-dependent NADH-azoreductase [Planctomycetota bacterium]|jgi:FMN-dependent NADH-azoreductase
MARLLYIKASPRTSRSHSIAVAGAFLESYLEANPDDSVQTIDLFQKDLPPFDLAAVTAKYKMMHTEDHSDQDKQVWAGVVSVIEEFKDADKYVFAVPMWNFSIPYRLKQYIDILVQPGQTFTVDADGNYQGFLTGRPAFIAYARGGEYPTEQAIHAYDFQKRYLELILGFMGLTDVRSIIVQPTLAAGPDAGKQKRAEAIEQAKKLAKDF